MSELSAISAGGNIPAAAAPQSPNTIGPSLPSGAASAGSQVSLSSASQTSIQMGRTSQTTGFSMSEQNMETMLLIAALMELLLGGEDDEDKGKKHFAVMCLMALLSQSSQQQMTAVSTTNPSYMAASVSTAQSVQANVVYGGEMATGGNLNVMG